MPRFFFDVRDGTETIDNEGTELRDVAHARVEAAKMAGALLSDGADIFWEGDEWTITVRDDREALFSLVFMAVDGGVGQRRKVARLAAAEAPSG